MAAISIYSILVYFSVLQIFTVICDHLLIEWLKNPEKPERKELRGTIFIF